MRFYVCWLLADESEAGAIRAATVEGQEPWSAWPHFTTRTVDGPDMNKLERIVQTRQKGPKTKPGGQLLAKGKMTDSPFVAVSRVEPAFVKSLATLEEADVEALAATISEKLDDVDAGAARQLLEQMAGLAREAEQSGKPVLEIDIM